MKTYWELKEDLKMHQAKVAAHTHHGNTHEAEVTNGGHDDHDYAGGDHHDAADAHKAAGDAFKKHGANSSQYKSAAAKAKEATNTAKEASSSLRFKKVAKPTVKI